MATPGVSTHLFPSRRRIFFGTPLAAQVVMVDFRCALPAVTAALSRGELVRTNPSIFCIEILFVMLGMSRKPCFQSLYSVKTTQMERAGQLLPNILYNTAHAHAPPPPLLIVGFGPFRQLAARPSPERLATAECAGVQTHVAWQSACGAKFHHWYVISRPLGASSCQLWAGRLNEARAPLDITGRRHAGFLTLP